MAGEATDTTEEQDVIDLEDTGDEEPEAEAGPAKPPGERPSKQARRNRYREAQEEALAARQEAQRERELRLREAELRQQAEARASQQQHYQTQVDPIDQALEENFRQRQALDEEYNLKKPTDPKTIQDMQRKSQWLEDQRAMLNVEKVNRARPRVDPEVQAFETYAAANHPEVVGNQDAVMYFRGELARRVASAKLSGRPVDASIAKECLEQTERDLKIGRYRNGRGIDPGLETRLSGHSRGAGSANGNGAISNGSIRMTDRLKAMAEQSFPELVREKGPAAAHEKWAKTVGKRLLAQGVKPSDA